MSGKNIAVFGIYPTHDAADAAVDKLRARGFRNTDVSVLIPQNLGSKEFGHEKGTKSAEGAVAGGGAGAVIGGALGWLAGIGMLAIPGVGPFIAAGPIVATLAGMGAGGAIGGVIGNTPWAPDDAVMQQRAPRRGPRRTLRAASQGRCASALRGATPRRGARRPARFGLRIVCAAQLE